MSIQESWLRAILSNNKCLESGVSASFFKLNDKYGFKYFCGDQWQKIEQSTSEGFWSYFCQRELHKYGLAPAVYGFCSYQGYFGFITERYDVAFYARQARRITEEQYQDCCDWGYQMEKMQNSPTGFYFDDMHRKNIGIKLDAENKIIEKVAIDVGYFNWEHCSFASNLDSTENIFHEDYLALIEKFDILKRSEVGGISEICDLEIQEPCYA